IPTGAAAASSPAVASAPSRSTANAPQSAHRRSGELAEPAPRESSLQMPVVRSAPEPEAMRPAPSPPALAALPARAIAAPPPGPVIATAAPTPAPPVPVLAPVAPPPAAVAATPKRTPAPTTVATLELRGSPGNPERVQIERVAALYKDKPGNVRVVGYAAPPSGADPLASYHAALERAQSVARALAEAGVPAGKIQTEAAPATGPGGAGRIEIQFAP